MSSHFLPPFLQRLEDSKTVLLVGCGGGFDFIHSTLLIPELRRLGKKIVIGSYSFGVPQNYKGDSSQLYWLDGQLVTDETKQQPAPLHSVVVKKIDATACTGAPDYAPELHMCSFLDKTYPETAPHSIYAYYARAWTIDGLHKFYQHLVEIHGIDTVVAMDGGTDSLVRGNESGLGDPIEDAVTLGAVSLLENVKHKLLITVGFGCDRFNGVSDCASLRAVAELTAAGGFLGSVSIDKDGEPFALYRALLDHIYERQTFRSVLAGATSVAVTGEAFGFAIPPELQRRVFQSQGNSGLYIWPLMGMLFAFDVPKVAARSLVVHWIRDAKTAMQNQRALDTHRAACDVLAIENMPHQQQFER